MGKNKQNSNNFGSKKSKWSILPIALSSVIAAGAVAGSVTSIWHISQNYTESSDFTKSVRGRIKVDPLNGYTDAEKKAIDESTVRNSLQDCAEKLSRWLKDSGQKSYDVSYELYTHLDEVDPDDRFEAYLNAQFDVNKILKRNPVSKEEEEEKIDNDPYLSFFASNAFNDNEKTLVYRWYLPSSQLTNHDRPYYSVIPFRDLFNIPKTTDSSDNKTKVIVDKDGKNGILYAVDDSKVDPGYDVKINDIYKNLAKAKKDSELKDDDEGKPEAIKNAWGQPRLYIINNINQLYNSVNYHISNWWANKDDPDYLATYKDTDASRIGSAYKETDWNGETRSHGEEYLKNYKLGSATQYQGEQSTPQGPQIANADIFNYIDQATAGTFSPDCSVATSYVQEIITFDKLDTFMPKVITDDYKNDTESEEPKINYFWYPKTTQNEAEVFLNNQIKYGFNKVALVDIDFSDITATDVGANDVLNRFKEHYSYTYIQPSLTETIFGGSNVIGVLSLGFLLFLIALLIILAVLYRTTGVMSWICLLFALSMTLLISTISSMAISFSLIMGMFTMAMVGFLACLAICGRMRRRLNSHEDTMLMIKKTFKKSLLPITDITVITLIFGICFTYIAPISLNSLGLILITGSFATFISIYLLNAALHGLFFNNNYLVNKYAFFGKPTNVANELLAQGNASVPTALDATKLEFPYFSVMSTKKIDATNKKTLIAVCVVGGLLIVGIVLFSVLGYASSSMFHTSNLIAINFNGDLFAQPWFKDLSYVSFTHDTESNWWYIYTNSPNAFAIAQQMATESGLTFGSQIAVTNIFGSTNQDILNLTLVSIIIATLCASVYGAIRYNWLSFVPMLAGAFGIPLLILGMASMCQIKIDLFVVSALVFVSVVNTIFSAGILASISETWSRKDAYNKQEFKYIVNASLTNAWQYIWNTAAMYIAFILIFAITAPASSSMVSVIGLLTIACIITMFVVPFTLAFLTYVFMKIRNIALSKLVNKNKSKIVVDYDEIDEQGIEGINKFTKRIPVASESKQAAK